jgi:hypothetical protein
VEHFIGRIFGKTLWNTARGQLDQQGYRPHAIPASPAAHPLLAGFSKGIPCSPAWPCGKIKIDRDEKLSSRVQVPGDAAIPAFRNVSLVSDGRCARLY